MKRVIIIAAFLGAFSPYLVLGQPYDRLFLSVFIGIMASLLLGPLIAGEVGIRASNFMQTLVFSLLAVTLVSLFMINVAGVLLNANISKYVGSSYVLFSMGGNTVIAFRLYALSSSLREVDDKQHFNSTDNGINHFAVDYSMLAWFRHGNYALISLGLLALYFYGWYLIGGPTLLLYSLFLEVFILFALRTLAAQLFAPNDPLEMVHHMESFHTPEKLTALLRLSPEAVIVFASLIVLAIFTNLVENPFGAGYALVFFLLIGVYLATLMIYVWRLGRK